MATSFVVSRHKNEAVAGIGIANGQITISIQGDGVVFHDGSTRVRGRLPIFFAREKHGHCSQLAMFFAITSAFMLRVAR